jgi:acetyltransferase
LTHGGRRVSYSIEHYPTRWIDVWYLADGRRVTVRPVLPQDAELEQALVRALSPASRYQRFFAPIRELPAGWLERLTQIDYQHQHALIVETFAGDQAVAVAEARYVVDAQRTECEFAVLVADDWLHQGLARRLMGSLMQAAAEAGLQRMVGDVLATNRAMLALARSLGFKVMHHPGGGAQVLRLERDLHFAAAAAPLHESAATAPGPSTPPAWAAT